MSIVTDHKVRELEIRVAAIEALLDAKRSFVPAPESAPLSVKFESETKFPRETLKLKRG